MTADPTGQELNIGERVVLIPAGVFARHPEALLRGGSRASHGSPWLSSKDHSMRRSVAIRILRARLMLARDAATRRAIEVRIALMEGNL